MSTQLVIVLAALAAHITAMRAAEWVATEFSAWLPAIVAGGAALVVTGWATWRVLRGVFSLHGLGYSFGVLDARWHGHALVWPGAVRAVTLLLLVETVVTIVWTIYYYADRGPERAWAAWLWAHVYLPGRLVGSGVWYGLVAPATVVADACRRRGLRSPQRPERFADVMAMAADRCRDAGDGLAALWSLARRRRARVTPTTLLPADDHHGVVIEGAFADPLPAWPAGDHDGAERRSA